MSLKFTRRFFSIFYSGDLAEDGSENVFKSSTNKWKWCIRKIVLFGNEWTINECLLNLIRAKMRISCTHSRMIKVEMISIPQTFPYCCSFILSFVFFFIYFYLYTDARVCVSTVVASNRLRIYYSSLRSLVLASLLQYRMQSLPHTCVYARCC